MSNDRVCSLRCDPCNNLFCCDPPEWHTWATVDDVVHALSTGQRDPSTTRCGCACAVVAP